MAGVRGSFSLLLIFGLAISGPLATQASASASRADTTLVAPAPPKPPPPPPRAVLDDDGANVGASREQVEGTLRGGERSGTEYEYRGTSYCLTGDPDTGNAEDVCLRAYVVCGNQSMDAGMGPATRIWRREVTTPESPWEFRLTTCFPDLADGPSGPTMADIVNAFHDTNFAKAGVNIQPEGDLTLVTLPTYFEARFPRAGFEPGEVDTVTLVGVPVQIRPGLASITYQLGDGRTLGPTASLGGPHPTGDVVATYPAPGNFQVRADVTYTGQFRIAGGQWLDIPGTLTIAGTPVTLRVATAQSRLVSP